MKKISNIMQSYFSNKSLLTEEIKLPFGLDTKSVPIEAKSITWDVKKDPERLEKTFKFKDPERLQDFIMEILQYENDINHHATITIESKDVTLGVYTHAVETITELDREYAEMADKIFEDVLHYGPQR